MNMGKASKLVWRYSINVYLAFVPQDLRLWPVTDI